MVIKVELTTCSTSLLIDKQLDLPSCTTRAELSCDGHIRSMGTFAVFFWTLEQED